MSKKKSNNQNDSSKVININELADKAVAPEPEKDKVAELSEIIEFLRAEIMLRDEEIARLRILIANPEASPLLIPTDEEMIAEHQLRRLKTSAAERELTLDEIKKFDLLIKNKRLAKQQPTTIEGKNNLKEDMSKESLINLATRKISAPKE